MNEERKIELFDKYRKDELSIAERTTFESSLSSNPLLKVEYQDYLNIVEGIRLFERENLKAFLMADTVADKMPKVVSLLNRKWMWAAAAAIVLLMALPIYNYLNFNEQLYAKHQLDTYNDNMMSMGTQSDLWQNYEDYKTGLQARQKGEFTVALASFEKVTKADWNPYFKAQYEIALIYIKQGDTKKGKDILNQILALEESHFVKDKAKEVLEDLEGSRFRWF